MEYILLALSAISILLLIAVLIMIKKSGTDEMSTAELQTQLALISKQLEQQQRQLSDESERSRREQRGFQTDMRNETVATLRSMTERLDAIKTSNYEYQQKLLASLNTSLNTIITTNNEQNERQSRIVSESIGKMQEQNEKKLDQMRETVDEKLTATLTTRLNSSFKTVSDQLENVYKSLGEMKELSTGVTDNVSTLNRVLTNVKARGTWAEVQLGNILDQTVPNMYVRNYSANTSSKELVEFAIRIPAGSAGEQDTFLPLDSKFPMEDYVRLCAAADSGDAEMVAEARKALERRIVTEARSITKYINVPQTTPFAIMYLANEGLYAEVVSAASGLPERLQSEFNIMVAGPTTITALLTSLSMGFRAVAINEKANEVRKLLAAAKQQYAKFGEVLIKAKKKIDEAGKTLDEAQDRNRIINNKLKNVEEIDSGESDEVLGIISGSSEE